MRTPAIALRSILSASVALCLWVLAGCVPETREDVVAHVGSAVITAEEFRLNYEFGHAHLRRGPDSKRQYLSYMTYEKIMAMEAERLGLDTADAVVHSLRTLREELLVERVFEDRVLSKIDVSDDEIEEAVNRSAVSFKFRFIPALSAEKAEYVYGEVLDRGFDDVLDEELTAFRDLNVPIGEVTSDYVKADEIDPTVLSVIKDLAIEAPSKPVAFGPIWYVFEVMDIRREPLADYDYEQRGQTVYKQIYNQRAMEAGAKFVASIMEPKGVTTKRRGFDILAEGLLQWYSHETPARNLLYYIEERKWDLPFTRLLVSNFDVPLVSFENQEWTIRTFLQHFTPGRYIIRAKDPDAFRGRLADVVALVVRDYFFLQMAERDHLDEDADFRRTMALWKEKWMFRQYRRLLAEGVVAERPDDVAEYLDNLAANRYRVAVNETLLDTLDVGLTDQHRHMTVHLLKNNSNKRPFPIVDPIWEAR